jgi:predicted DNA-binding transcriptional regulator AlpA
MEAGSSIVSSEFIGQQEVAEMLAIRPRLINQILKTDESFPKPLVVSKRIKRWKKDDIVGWINSKMS